MPLTQLPRPPALSNIRTSTSQELERAVGVWMCWLRPPPHWQTPEYAGRLELIIRKFKPMYTEVGGSDRGLSLSFLILPYPSLSAPTHPTRTVKFNLDLLPNPIATPFPTIFSPTHSLPLSLRSYHQPHRYPYPQGPRSVPRHGTISIRVQQSLLTGPVPRLGAPGSRGQ